MQIILRLILLIKVLNRALAEGRSDQQKEEEGPSSWVYTLKLEQVRLGLFSHSI